MVIWFAVVPAALVLGIVLGRWTATHRLAQESAHDRVTGLANRSLLERRLAAAVASARRQGHPLAVLFVDLERVRAVNEALGWGAGDDVLVAVADRIRGCVRAEDTVARVGGDELAVLLEQVVDVTASARVAERIIGALREPVEAAERSVYVGASIGIAVADGDEPADDLLRDAAVAARRAAEQGRGRYELFVPELGEAARRRLSLEAALRRAVDAGEIHVDLHPQVRLDTEELVGVEAVARWSDAAEGELGHVDLLRLATEAGLQHVVGRHILAEACRAGRRLQRQRPILRVHVDVPPGGLTRGGAFVQEVADVLRATAFPAGSLVLEAAEEDLREHPADALTVIDGLRAVGAQTAIGGFGAGATSLTWLKHFPATILKLDPSVLAERPEATDRAITRSVLQLAGALGLTVVAEGVDNREQHQALRALGCSAGQGRWFSDPVSEDELLALVADDRWAGDTDLPATPRQ